METAADVDPRPADRLPTKGPLVAARNAPGFEERPYELFGVDPATPTIGAEVSGIRLSGDLSEEVLAELKRALLEWKVLFFRDQEITRDDHQAFAERWGELEQHPFFKYQNDDQDHDQVATLSRGDAMGGVENLWHNDVTFRACPSFAAILRAVEVPPVGGDTLWCDTGAAYDTLPEEIKDRIDPLYAEHDWLNSFGRGMSQELIDQLRPEFPAVQHPVVRVISETGRRVLFVNDYFTMRILGVSNAESAELLSLLYRHVTRPEFQVRLRWRPNTVAMWDNRSCQHYATSDYYPQRRVMNRISIIGDRPLGIADVA